MKDSLADLPDLTVMDVQELIYFAEDLINSTSGIVHGERRKAMGIRLIQEGINVLKGKMSTGKGIKNPLKQYIA